MNSKVIGKDPICVTEPVEKLSEGLKNSREVNSEKSFEKLSFTAHFWGGSNWNLSIIVDLIVIEFGMLWVMGALKGCPKTGSSLSQRVGRDREKS